MEDHTLTPPKDASPPVAADEDPWSDLELAEVMTELQSDLRRHQEQAAAVSEGLDELRQPENASGDTVDVGTSTFERDQELAIAVLAQESVRQTRGALERIVEGEWGLCQNCGEPIGKARLKAYPRATRCITCKEREERV